jgi:hypothetical protein
MKGKVQVASSIIDPGQKQNNRESKENKKQNAEKTKML